MLYLCWNNESKIKGVATSKKHAEEMCNEIGDCYHKIVPNTVPEEDIEITKMSVHHTQLGFFTYDEAVDLVKEIAGLE